MAAGHGQRLGVSGRGCACCAYSPMLQPTCMGRVQCCTKRVLSPISASASSHVFTCACRPDEPASPEEAAAPPAADQQLAQVQRRLAAAEAERAAAVQRADAAVEEAARLELELSSMGDVVAMQEQLEEARLEAVSAREELEKERGSAKFAASQAAARHEAVVQQLRRERAALEKELKSAQRKVATQKVRCSSARCSSARSAGRQGAMVPQATSPQPERTAG